jgi:BirA family biotin operon repressor/biotin-[acetyl-CoA-carboxylase] ligase
MNYQLTWFLRRHATAYHAPDDLAALAGLPLPQLHRALEKMAAASFRFEHHPIMGLRLAAAPEAIDRDEIAFARRDGRIGRTIRIYERTRSTNDLALAAVAAESETEGLTIIAEEQTAGRGRQGASWLASRGKNSLASVVHWAGPTAAARAGLMLAASVAVCDAVTQVTGLRAAIKWPNDVELDRRKVAGILIESPDAARQRRPPGSKSPAPLVPYVIGLGLNVNQADFPPEIADRATSLALAAGDRQDRTLLLERTLAALESRLQQAAGPDAAGLMSEYLARSDMTGRAVTVKEGARVFRGTVEAVSPDFCLVLRLESGAVRAFDAAQVSLVRN